MNTNYSDHAKFAPSSMSRVIKCPASVRESTFVPAEPSSIYAERGTLLHGKVDEFLLSGRNMDVLKDLPEPAEEGDEQQVLMCIDFIDELTEGKVKDSQLILEKRVDLKEWGIPHLFGRCDWQLPIFKESEEILHVVDWKFGSNVVYAADNPQLLLYAAGAVGYPITWDKMVLHVFQPPLDHHDEFEFNAKYLKDFIFDTVIPTIELAESADPPFNPGKEQCHFCPAKMKCRARYTHQQGLARDIFQAYSDIPNVSNDEIAVLLDKCDEQEQYLKQVRLYAHRELLAGRPVRGRKLVAGKSMRKWKNEAAAMKFLEERDTIEELFKSKFLSPNQCEQLDRKLKKDKAFQDLWDKKPGKPQLALESDKRKALEPERQAAVAFAKFATDDEGEL